MGRVAAAAARTVTAAVLENPSQAVRFSSAIGSMPWSTKPPARSLRAIVIWICPSGPYQIASTSAPATGLPSSPATVPRTSAPRRSSIGGSSCSAIPRPGIFWGAFAMSAGSKKGEGNRIGQPIGWPASRRIRPANRPAASVVTKRSPPKKPLRTILTPGIGRSVPFSRTRPRTCTVSRSGIATSVACPAFTISRLGSSPRRGGPFDGSNSSSSATVPAAMAGIANRPWSSQANAAVPRTPDPM